MRRVFVLLTLLGLFAFTAMAQTADTSKTATKTKSKMSTMAKESHVTGCISAQPDAEGVYTLTNGRYKKGLEVGPADTVKEHAGHKVELMGKWASPKDIGANEATAKEHAFEATSVKMISETCSAPATAAKSKAKKPKGTS